MSYIVALTGGIACGKTTVSTLFSKLNVPVVDADIIAREVIKPGTSALKMLVNHFGQQVLLPDNTLNRAKLREIVFNNSQERDWLNKLLHPLIQQETLARFKAIDAPYLIWVIPLLIENNLTHLADRILVIDVDYQTQLKRIMQRDGSDKQLAENILKAQVSRDVRLSYADDIISNTGSLESIHEKVNSLHEQYLLLAQKKHDLV